jgi:hypothetical protein
MTDTTVMVLLLHLQVTTASVSADKACSDKQKLGLLVTLDLPVIYDMEVLSKVLILTPFTSRRQSCIPYHT